jgi:hypothetical protein
VRERDKTRERERERERAAARMVIQYVQWHLQAWRLMTKSDLIVCRHTACYNFTMIRDSIVSQHCPTSVCVFVKASLAAPVGVPSIIISHSLFHSLCLSLIFSVSLFLFLSLILPVSLSSSTSLSLYLSLSLFTFVYLIQTYLYRHLSLLLIACLTSYLALSRFQLTEKRKSRNLT